MQNSGEIQQRESDETTTVVFLLLRYYAEQYDLRISKGSLQEMIITLCECAALAERRRAAAEAYDLPPEWRRKPIPDIRREWRRSALVVRAPPISRHDFIYVAPVVNTEHNRSKKRELI